jgi:stage V sporulation protein B
MFGQFTGKYVLLTTLPVSLSVALAAAVVPNLAFSQAATDLRDVHKKINMALRLSMLISIPAAVGLGVLAQPILTLLFRHHDGGANLLHWGVAAIIFLALVQILTGILQGISRERIPMIGAFFGMLIKIPLNWLLIAHPQINVIGAVMSTIACYALASGINLYYLKKYTGITPDLKGAFVKPLVASAVMGLACYVFYYLLFELTASNGFATLGAIATGILVFGLVMVAVKGFEREDFERLPLGWVRKWL